MNLENILLVGVGGFVGANVRYLMTLAIQELVGRRFPLATFVINVSGSFLLAVFLAWLANRTSLNESLRLLIAVGFFGAYTTFSSFANESITLFQEGNWIGGMLYVAGTNLLCLVVVLPGLWLGSRL